MGKMILAFAFVLISATAHAGERAWLAPAAAKMEVGRVVISFGNVGSAPAVGFVSNEEFGTVPQPGGYKEFQRAWIKPICPKSVAGAGVLFQSGLRDYRYRVRFPVGFKPAAGMLPYVHGCFSYKTAGNDVERVSEYCFILRGKDSIRCPWGNDAN